jgi:anhydro-N-acetylmuramic acid kinase
MQANSYQAIGVMSGSSLDGLDIAFVALHEAAGQWTYEWLAADCLPYPPEWRARLQSAQSLSVPDFLKMHAAYGHFIGRAIRDFLQEKGEGKKPDFITSHGHTVFHAPRDGVSCQIGDGAAIAAETGIPVICDLRNMDVALGGQGAPIVPIGDRLLFGDYDFLLNLGGIANITIQRPGLAFDVCPCNQLLNHFAQQLGFEFDRDGTHAKQGKASQHLLAALRSEDFYRQPPPKSLANEFSQQNILPRIAAESHSAEDALATCSAHIADSIANALLPYLAGSSKMLVTGGGALNGFLVAQLRERLQPTGLEIVVPDERLVQYKEALVMALIGALRWRGEVNVLSTVTGASRDSIGGTIWAGSHI